MRIRTGYSFRTATGHLPEVISRLQEIGWKDAPISDRMSTFGFNRWAKASKKAGLRPVFGVEIGVVANLGEKKPVVDYWTFFAKDDLRELHSLISLATLNPGREPTLTYEQATAANAIKIAGERVRLDRISPETPNLYIGLSPSMPRAVFREASTPIKAKKGSSGGRKAFRFVAVSDNVYTRKEDLEFYRIALGRNASTQSYPQHILDDAEWAAAVGRFASAKDKAAALRNRSLALAGSRAALPLAQLLKPKRPKSLAAMCKEGAKLLGVNLDDPVYKARLKRELDLIKEKQFEDYFYIIADMVTWARERMVVGPARGSSCGSLVCYLLRITTVDPIPYGLIFERFIDINRADLPDIDIDFSDVNRDKVFAYAEEKYGTSHVARLGTVGMFAPKSAIKQASFALAIPKWVADRAMDGLITRSSADSRAMFALEDTLKTTPAGRLLLDEYPEAIIAARLEGHPSHPSQHAAGIVITEAPVAEYVAVNERTKSIMCDKKDAEDYNLLKIDALGLTQLSIFERTMELIGEKPVSGWLEKLPLDDPKAFEVLNKRQFAGIFQFNGGALQSLTKQIDANHLEDIVAITALARPGPMATGGSNEWVQRRIGKHAVEYFHPILEQMTKTSLGIVIYQEQVMEIARIVGKLSWDDVTTIRKAMSKSMGDEFFEASWQKFRIGAIENGLPEADGRYIWDQINKFGSWAFNRSHAVAYALISYWCCWLKAHHPLEFAAATLDAEAEPIRQIAFLRELKAEGIDYVPIDRERSVERWIPVREDGRSYLVGPLTSIKGIGPSSVKEILTCRAKGTPLRPALAKRLDAARTDLASLYPIADGIKRLCPDLSKVFTAEPTKIVDIQCDPSRGRNGYEVRTFALARKIAPRDDNDPANVAKRGGKRYPGKTQALNLFFQDDTDEMFCKVSRFDYDRLGREIVERGKAGKALYAIKGVVPPDFRMIRIENIRYLGDLEADLVATEEEKETEE